MMKDPMHDALREAFRREDPGPEFTARLLARVREAEACVPWWRALGAAFRPAQFRWAAATALACVLIAGGAIEHHRLDQERLRGESAKQQLLVALRIAGTKLNLARDRVREVGAARPE